MDNIQLQVMADAAAKKAVAEVLLHLGIDANDPIKTQAEFQAVRELATVMKDAEIAEDIAFVRRLRKASDTIQDTTWKTIVRVLVTGAVGVFLIGTKDWWLSHIKG
jgi:hypothetical protein